MTERILLVDDDPQCLAAWQRVIADRFSVDAFQRPREALTRLQRPNCYALIIVDYRMPDMDGIDFLKRASAMSPDSLRILLTADEEQRTAARAINDCEIFRFLTKPVSGEAMVRACQDALARFRQQVLSRELHDDDLQGCLFVLTDVLAMTNPEAFRQGKQLRDIVGRICRVFPVDRPWELEYAAVLSAIGVASLPPHIRDRQHDVETLSEDQRRLVVTSPLVAANVVRQIPSLERVAGLIAALVPEENAGRYSTHARHIEVRILRAAVAMQSAICRGLSPQDALQLLDHERHSYGDELLAAVEAAFSKSALSVQPLRFRELRSGMLLADPVLSSDGMVLFQMGTRLSEPKIARLHYFAQKHALREPIFVLESA